MAESWLILENAVETTDFADFTDTQFSRTESAFTSQVRFEPESSLRGKDS
jgi:hypothetical protein